MNVGKELTMARRRVKSKTYDFSEVFSSMVTEYADEVQKQVLMTMEEMGKDTSKELKRVSPKNTGEYASGWTYRIETNSFGSIKVVIYNAEKPTLTHLLENGYIARNGERVGQVEHIKDVQKTIENEALRKMKRGLDDIQ